MNKLITVYHGSKQVVEAPTFGLGRKNNDFGLGFYCTESNELAKEWAVSSLSDGFSNRYTLDTEYLNVLRLNSPEYTILNWMAVLVAHRLFSLGTPVARRAKQYLIEHFGINVNAYDLIISWRKSFAVQSGEALFSCVIHNRTRLMYSAALEDLPKYTGSCFSLIVPTCPASTKQLKKTDRQRYWKNTSKATTYRTC